MSLNNLDAITSQFETRSEDMPRISTSSTKPNYTSLKNFQDAIDANAMSIMSSTTELGHLALTRSPTEFTLANGTAFVIPLNPGTAPNPPPRIGTRASAAALALDPTATAETSDPYKAQEALRTYQDSKHEYNLYRNASTALKHCITTSVDDEYIKALKKKITRYATVTPLELLTHLWTTYGEVTIVDLGANETRMKVQWNPPSPIESLFLQLEDGQAFASEGNETIDDSILVRLGYDNILATGQFTKYCAKWRKRAIADQKWPDFRKCFTEYNKERSDSMSVEEASYSINL